MAITASRAKIGVICLAFFGGLLLVIGVVALSLMPTLLQMKLKENIVLQEGKEVFEKWKTTPIPVTFKVYLFNITNPKEVMKGEKPHMAEVGPFVYEQWRSKKVLEWNKEMKTVTYRDLKKYIYLPEKSLNDSLKIYTLNLPLQGIVMFLKKLPDFTRSLMMPLLEGVLKNYEENLFIHRAAKELMFGGYKLNLVQDLVDIARNFIDVPEVLPNNTFGYLADKNNSGDGVFEVFTGEDDIAKYSQIVKWNNMSRIPFWNNEFCNMMNGTDGGQFPPPVTRKDVLYVYTPDLCRSVFLEYGEDTTVRGIPALRFITPPRLFASPYVNPDNMCYCTMPEYCHLSGILDVSPCRHGIKLALSGPHFYRGHPFFQDTVSGLNPSAEEHDVFVDIEPTTGFVLRAARKLQLNFLLEPFADMEETKNIPSAVIPLVWVVEEAEIPENVAAEFTARIRTPVTVAKSVLTACIVLGLLWIVTAGFVTFYILMKEQRTAKAAIKNKYKAVPQKPEDIVKTEKIATTNA